MIKIKENVLSVAGVNFKLPNQCFIDIEGLEEIHEDGLRLASIEGDFTICTLTSHIDYMSAVNSIMDIFMNDVISKDVKIDFFKYNETGFKWIAAPENCDINGLKAACVQYETPFHYYYEIHFERLKGYDRQLEICIYTQKDNSNLESILSKQNVIDFINSFKPDNKN